MFVLSWPPRVKVLNTELYPNHLSQNRMMGSVSACLCFLSKQEITFSSITASSDIYWPTIHQKRNSTLKMCRKSEIFPSYTQCDLVHQALSQYLWKCGYMGPLSCPCNDSIIRFIVAKICVTSFPSKDMLENPITTQGDKEN